MSLWKYILLAGWVVLFATPLLGQQQQPDPKLPNPNPPRLDVGKGTIERPTKNLLASLDYKPAGKGFVNPKVAPGLIRWHPSFEAACAAAKKSGKPVLLFQLMGQLDQEFC